MAYSPGPDTDSRSQNKLVRAVSLQPSSAITQGFVEAGVSFSYELDTGDPHEQAIPLSVFGTDLGVLETIAVHQHDAEGRGWTRIAQDIGRSPKTVFAAYHHAKRRHPEALVALTTGMLIPLGIFKDPRLGPLESLVRYLISSGIAPAQAARLLGRDVQTIYTSLRRARIKREDAP